MLVIVSVRRLDNDRMQIAVARPQHDLNRSLEYDSEQQIREVLPIFGISTEAITLHLKLLTQMDANEQLNFPPIDIPQQTLLSLGFRL
jgi:hypothetical protein